jgi:hypothetical protein
MTTSAFINARSRSDNNSRRRDEGGPCTAGKPPQLRRLDPGWQYRRANHPLAQFSVALPHLQVAKRHPPFIISIRNPSSVFQPPINKSLHRQDHHRRQAASSSHATFLFSFRSHARFDRLSGNGCPSAHSPEAVPGGTRADSYRCPAQRRRTVPDADLPSDAKQRVLSRADLLWPNRTLRHMKLIHCIPFLLAARHLSADLVVPPECASLNRRVAGGRGPAGELD